VSQHPARACHPHCVCCNPSLVSRCHVAGTPLLPWHGPASAEQSQQPIGSALSAGVRMLHVALACLFPRYGRTPRWLQHAHQIADYPVLFRWTFVHIPHDTFQAPSSHVLPLRFGDGNLEWTVLFPSRRLLFFFSPAPAACRRRLIRCAGLTSACAGCASQAAASCSAESSSNVPEELCMADLHKRAAGLLRSAQRHSLLHCLGDEQ
jgi:hypothetical protein